MLKIKKTPYKKHKTLKVDGLEKQHFTFSIFIFFILLFKRCIIMVCLIQNFFFYITYEWCDDFRHITIFMKKLHFSNFSFSHTIPSVCATFHYMYNVTMALQCTRNLFSLLTFLLSFCVTFFFYYSAIQQRVMR